MKTFKRYTCLLALLCCMTVISCTSDDEASRDEEIAVPEEGGTTYWYYSYGVGRVLKAEDFGFADNKQDFQPHAVYNIGDTLLIANKGKAGNFMLLYDLKKSSMLSKFDSWTFNGSKKSFGSSIEAFAQSGDRLYVSECGSRIHAFTLPNLEYISCIGNGNYWDAVFNVQALAVTDGLIYARSKDSEVRIYRESDVTPDNYQKIWAWKKAAGTGDQNNGFNSQNMVVNEDGNILLTAHEGKFIRTLDVSKVNDEMTNGTSIDIAEERIEADFKPWTIALTEDKLYVAGNNKCINLYDRKQKKWTRKFKSIQGYSFGSASRIHNIGNDTFWVSDTDKHELVEVIAYRNEIHEYERVNTNMLRVFQPNTRGSQPTTHLLIDLQTHEVVSEN